MTIVAGVLLCLPLLWLLAVTLATMHAAARQNQQGVVVFVLLTMALACAFVGGSLLRQAGWGS